MTRRHRLASLLLVALCGCDDAQGNSTAPPASASADTPTQSAAPDGRAEALLRLELTRDVQAITAEDLSHRDVAVRRQAARALARARDEAARELLLRALADEDPQVVAWAAYGLGDVCAGHRDATVSALVATAAVRDVGASPDGAAIDVHRAIARAVGRCAGSQSERTLVTWARLRGPHMLDAIYALGDLAREHKRLREDTYVALLELAEGNASMPPVPEALYPIGRVENLTPSVIDRTREVATARLAQASVARAYAVRALGRVDESAVPLLQQVLSDPTRYNAAERAEAAGALTRFGRAGQKALSEAVAQLVPSDGAIAELVSPDVGPLLAALAGITDIRKAKPALEKLARLPPPADASTALRRRLSWIRCTAAGLLAERDYDNPDLRACDLSVPEAERAKNPLAGSIGARAIVAAIGVDAVKITGPRLEAWKAYAQGGDIRARQAALAQLKEHFEIRESADVLAKALAAEQAGVVATAAEVITAVPIRAVKRDAQPKKDDGDKSAPPPAMLHEALVAALLARLDATGATEDIEALSAVIDAVGTLGLADAKEKLVTHCGSPHRSVREHAQTALAKIMGKASPRCTAGKQLGPPVELERRLDKPATIVFETDVGTLRITLDPHHAPVAATRAVDLAKNGFYDGMVVHRVVPGFVSQFGSPTFDGYGGVSGLPPLPCETSPLHFAPLTVGVALAGRDTGSSQLFVTHAPTPHLDGNYALIGSASGPWDALIDGDVIQRATVE